MSENERTTDQGQPKHCGEWTPEKENRDVYSKKYRVPDVSMQTEKPQAEFFCVPKCPLHEVDNNQLYGDE